MQELIEDPRTEVSYADQCQFGLTSKIQAGSSEEGPAKKPTGFIGNAWAVMHELRRTCDNSHTHVRLEGGRAKAAALYPDELCVAVCQGLVNQIAYDEKQLKCLGTMNQVELEETIKGMVDTAIDWIGLPGLHEDPEDKTENEDSRKQQLQLQEEELRDTLTPSAFALWKGSHGDSPPVTDEGRQAGGQKDEDAHRHSPQPKPSVVFGGQTSRTRRRSSC